MEIQFFYRLDTLQIDAVYRDCKSNSAVFKDAATYMEVNVTDSPYEVTRNHKVVLDAEGNVIGTETLPNPVQPLPTPNRNQDIIDKLTGDAWTTGVPPKIELLKEAVLRLLGT